MPRKRSQGDGKARGPRKTANLSGHPDARRTWSGPPYSRTPGRWSGAIDFDGKKHHVGTYDTPRLWGEARDKKFADLVQKRIQAQQPTTPLQGVTIAEFVGRVGEKWPWQFKRKGKRKVIGTMLHHEQCIRALVASFGDRMVIGGLSPEEGEEWANGATENQVTSAIAMFNDARSRDRTVVNPLQGLSRQRTRGRRDLPDVLTVFEVDLLIEIAGRVHTGPYAPIMQGMVVLMADCGLRPGELWAGERPELNVSKGELYLNWAVKKNGSLGPPKYGQRRHLVLTPRALKVLLELPLAHDRWLFPTKTGRLLQQSNWTNYWHPVREAFTAQLPDDHWLVRRIARCSEALMAESDPAKRKRMPSGKLDFYELRHRAITYMVTPKPDGLGMDPADVALQVGHRDGGRLIWEVYVHLNSDLARRRMRRAMGYDDECAA